MLEGADGRPVFDLPRSVSSGLQANLCELGGEDNTAGPTLDDVDIASVQRGD
jgi:hypothetical protein